MYDPSVVVNIALAEVGYLEKSREAYKKNPKIIYEKTAGAGYDNYTKYGYEMHNLYPAVMDFPAYYCDSFVDWCFMKAYGVSNAKYLLAGDFDDYTVNSAKLYKKKDAYYHDPLFADQIFFNNGSRICHTGIVIGYDNTYVEAVEGNTSGASGVIANGGGVVIKKYKRNDKRIDGYGRPNYNCDAYYKPLFHDVFYQRVYGVSQDPYLDFKKNTSRIPSPVFDCAYYKNNNPDLREKFGDNDVEYIKHFIEHGMREGKRASFTFDVKYYLKNNLDLKDYFGNNYTAAITHFILCGINEARKTSKDFNVIAYRNKNSDLAFGCDWLQYHVHYYTNGRNENRHYI